MLILYTVFLQNRLNFSSFKKYFVLNFLYRVLCHFALQFPIPFISFPCISMQTRPPRQYWVELMSEYKCLDSDLKSIQVFIIKYNIICMHFIKLGLWLRYFHDVGCCQMPVHASIKMTVCFFFFSWLIWLVTLLIYESWTKHELL